MQNVLTLLSPVRWRPVRSIVTPNLFTSLPLRPSSLIFSCLWETLRDREKNTFLTFKLIKQETLFWQQCSCVRCTVQCAGQRAPAPAPAHSYNAMESLSGSRRDTDSRSVSGIPVLPYLVSRV